MAAIGQESFRALIVTALLLTSCYASHRAGTPPPPPPECVLDAGLDAGEAVHEAVDLLFVIDNSNSMSEEQASVVAELPDIVRALGSGDIDLDGIPDVTPVGSLHIGAVTTDMGVGGFPVPTCGTERFGDDGRLRQQGAPELDGCAPRYPSFLRYEPPGGMTTDQIAFAAGCLVTAGTGGCAFEQPLEAALKALTPSTSSLRFFDLTTGHGDGRNAGFLRPDSVLVILVVTDEDDCSAQTVDLFNPSSTEYGGTDFNLRCALHQDALYPVERYARGLLDLRASSPGRLVYATITGIPAGLADRSEAELLADPALEVRVDPASPHRILPSCDAPSRGLAFPPRRLLEVGAAVHAAGGRTIHRSICQSDYSAAVRLILAEVGRAVRPRCP